VNGVRESFSIKKKVPELAQIQKLFWNVYTPSMDGPLIKSWGGKGERLSRVGGGKRSNSLSNLRIEIVPRFAWKCEPMRRG